MGVFPLHRANLLESLGVYEPKAAGKESMRGDERNTRRTICEHCLTFQVRGKAVVGAFSGEANVGFPENLLFRKECCFSDGFSVDDP